MPNSPARSAGSDPEELSQSLTERVMARVVDARSAVDRREGATRPKSKRRRQKPVESLSDGPSAQELREFESLKTVFRDLGVSYRQYRRQTGEPVAPAVREAAYQFRASPSLTSLVSVAVYLDELDILTW
ncbi:MAG: hypothetical protein ACJ8BF_11770 [Gemmatimonadales bacterium]